MSEAKPSPGALLAAEELRELYFPKHSRATIPEVAEIIENWTHSVELLEALMDGCLLFDENDGSAVRKWLAKASAAIKRAKGEQ